MTLALLVWVILIEIEIHDLRKQINELEQNKKGE